MRHLNILILFFFLTCCNNTDSGISNKDSVNKENDSLSEETSENKAIVPPQNNDTVLMNLSNSILTYLKVQDYTRFADFIHPEFGIRFSPYGNVDTLRNKLFSKDQYIELSQHPKNIYWGIFDGTGDSINLTFNKYFDRFVYDADFLNAEKKSVNKIISSDISLNNIQAVYRDCDLVEFYFSGFKAKYQGMDWRALMLVFKKYHSKYYLVGIIHDQWKI